MFKNPKTDSTTERKPIKLPEVPEDQKNVAGIFQFLRDGKPIWVWYSMTDRPNKYITKYLTGKMLDGFAVWRVVGDYLYMYIAHFDAERIIHLKLSEIRRMTNTDVFEAIESHMTYAYSIMYDDAGLTEQTLAFVTDITQEMIEKELHDKSVWIIGDEHFCKKSDS